jgi:hypothetical protein
MAKADPKDIPSHPQGAEEWTVDGAFQYLTRVVSLPDNRAVDELTETVLNGRLPMTCRRFVIVDGKRVLDGAGVVRPDFWRDHLTLFLADGQARVRPLKALDPGEYEYSLPAQIVREIWRTTAPPASEPRKEQPKRKAGGKPEFDWDALHARCVWCIDENGCPDNISQFTRDLLEWCQNQFDEDATPDFETARKYVVRWIAAWERTLPPN